MNNLNLVKATEANIETIRDLAEKIWWKHYPAIIGETQVTYMLNLMYSESVLRNLISTNKQTFYLINIEDNTIGFIAVEERQKNELFLQKFYILSDRQNIGAGTASFDLLLKQYPDVEVIRLQVNRMNYKPINFYFKLGFQIETAQDFEIGEDFLMEDFVMINRLKYDK